MNIRELNRAPKGTLRIANITYVAHAKDIENGVAHPRPARTTFECWRAPWDFPFSTSKDPCVEVEPNDLVDTVLQHFGERGSDAGLYIVFPGNEAAILAQIKAWEADNPGKAPVVTQLPHEITQGKRASLLGEGIPMYLSDGDRLRGAAVASGRGRSAALNGARVILERGTRGSSPAA